MFVQLTVRAAKIIAQLGVPGLSRGKPGGNFMAMPVLAEREQQRSSPRAPEPSPRPMIVPGTQLVRRLP